MPFNWKEYLKLAQFLQGCSEDSFTQEAAFRCAVSRAYFAAFCHARNFARDKQHYEVSDDLGDHGRLKRHFVNTGKRPIATILDQLRGWRNDCDYQDEVPGLEAMLQSALKKSEEIFIKIHYVS